MMRIIALNEDSQEHSADETEVTKEAQETIAVSEYMRALKLKNDGKIDDALFLFSELLETNVLIDVPTDQKDNKLFSVKYNCYRNIGFIYEKKSENTLALKFLFKAMELDDTDVFTMSKLGQLALKVKNIEVAKIAFDKCLLRNPNHWPSIDGSLQVLCLSENMLDAYGYALNCYNLDNSYERAYNVLSEIIEKFPSNIKFFQSVYEGSFKLDAEREKLRKKKKSNFPEYYVPVLKDDFEPVNIDYDKFKIEKVNWETIGNLIIDLYSYLEENNNNICTVFDLNNFLPKTELKNDSEMIINNITEHLENQKDNSKDMSDTTEPNSRRESVDSRKDDLTSAEISESEFLSPTAENIVSQLHDSANEDGITKSDDPAITPESKPRARRRGSELSILEQWGWHKTRRASRKKSIQSEQNDAVDTTINGFVKRIFASYFCENIDPNEFPFIEDCTDITNKENKSDIIVNGTCATIEDFQENTKNEFDRFIKELSEKQFDLYISINKWLASISSFWNQQLPTKLFDIYMKIYDLYLKYFDAQQWNLYEKEEFQSSFRMMLFFLELEQQKLTSFSKEIPTDFRLKILHLTAYSGHNHSSTDEEYYNTVTRLVWLQYCIALYDENINLAIACLLKIEEYLNQYRDDFKLLLVNQKKNNYFDLSFLKRTKSTLQRKLCLSNVKELYDQNKFEDLVLILKDCLMHTLEFKPCEELPLKLQIQVEVLIESLWRLDKPDECLIWCEKCLKYSLDHFLAAPSDTPRQRDWGENVNFILTYIEALLMEETNLLLNSLSEKYLARMIQNLTKIVANQLDSPYDKNNPQSHIINLNKPWIILYQVLQKDEDKITGKKSASVTSPSENISVGEYIEENIPNTITMFFTAHDYMGRKGWCARDSGKFLLYTLDIVAPILRSTILEPVRELVTEYIEQITYCLYGYPAKKARSRHIEEHDAVQIDLTWERALQLFDIYRPDNLPEFNSYKLESISAEMEQLLNKILALIPKEYDPTPQTVEIRDFISGLRTDLPDELHIVPSRISCIYYLLGDYYFKSRDFSKTIRFYILDLLLNPSRFDSWAGLALSKATKMETKLNSCQPINSNDIFLQFEETSRCFEQCLKIHRKQTLLWIEYGTFSYSIHAFCSRNLKQYSDTLSMEKFVYVEEKKEECIKIAYNCFDIVNRELSNDATVVEETDEDPHNERWLYHYMLGKISEKKKEQPSVFLTHYLQSAKFLYENNATYPFKINHSNPQNLSIEALEIFYRISASIIKYTEQHSVVQRNIGKLFNRVLKELATSPFALNQAKIDDSSINALKRKLNQNLEEGNEVKIIKLDNQTAVVENVKIQAEEKSTTTKSETILPEETPMDTIDASENLKVEEIKIMSSSVCNLKPNENINKPSSPSRRGSQESNATTTSTSTTGNSSSTSSSSSSESSGSESSSSDSESDSSSDDENKNNLSDDTPFTESELENIYKICIKNFEECVTRFPEHYKSIYRLVNYYLNSPTKLRDFEKCKQLLLGTYKTSLGNSVQGLFFERKTNNFFNGIWRIPSSEIDRAGSFSSHLSKCVVILMDVLKTACDYNTLLDLALQLQRTPEPDKRYLKDSERKELFQQAISFCIQTFRGLLKKHSDSKNCAELLNLMIDIFKGHRKCVKNMQQKDALFNSLLIDSYKAYIKDKVILPETANLMDLACKLCQYEITSRKNQEKFGISTTSSTTNATTTPTTSSGLTSLEITTGVSYQSKPHLNTVTTTATVTSLTPSQTTVAALTINPTKVQQQQQQRERVSSPAVTQPTTTQSSSTQQRSRGKAVAKTTLNVPPTTSSMNVGIPFSDSSLMATMLAMYSNPNLVSNTPQITDTNLMSALMADYYTKLTSAASFGGLSNISPIMSSLSMNLVPPISHSVSLNKPISSSSKSKAINLGSQMTITPTTVSSGKDQTGTKSNNHKTSKDKLSNSSALPSVLKKDLPSFSSKILQDLAGAASSSQTHQFSNQGQHISLIPELPKSLTITPTTVSFSDKIEMGKKLNQLKNVPSDLMKQKDNAKYIEKLKYDNKKSDSSRLNPYARNLTKEQMSVIQMSQFPHLQDYNRQLSILSQQYADAMKYSNAMNMGSGNTSQQKKQVNRKPQQQQQHHHPQLKHNQSPSISPHSAISKTPPVGSGAYIKNSSPNLINSPTKSPIIGTNLPRQSMTPPNMPSGQTKTLQQKLAEQKQKANASMIMKQNEANNSMNRKDANKKKGGLSNEVIILE